MDNNNFEKKQSNNLKNDMLSDNDYKRYKFIFYFGIICYCVCLIVLNLCNIFKIEIIINNQLCSLYAWIITFIPLALAFFGSLKCFKICKNKNYAYKGRFKTAAITAISLAAVIAICIEFMLINSSSNYKAENIKLQDNQNFTVITYNNIIDDSKNISVCRTYGIFARKLITKVTDKNGKYNISNSKESGIYYLTVYENKNQQKEYKFYLN